MTCTLSREIVVDVSREDRGAGGFKNVQQSRVGYSAGVAFSATTPVLARAARLPVVT